MHDAGNTLSNVEVLQCMQNSSLEIARFERGNLKLAHYRLRPGNAFKIGGVRPDGTRRRRFFHDFGDGPLTLEPHEYLLITPLERVFLQEGIVAQICAASTLTEQGFGLVAGKLDPGYGRLGGQQQEFVMGLYNQMHQSNIFYPDRGFANISFVSFRAIGYSPTYWQESELVRYDERSLRRLRAEDDGVFYPSDDEW